MESACNSKGKQDTTRNAWQSLAYSLLGAAVSFPDGSTILFCYYLLGATLRRRAGYMLGFAKHF